MFTELEKKLIKESLIKSLDTKRNLTKCVKLFNDIFGEAASYPIVLKDEKIIAIDDTLFEIARKLEDKYGYDRNKYPHTGLVSDELCQLLYVSDDESEVIADMVIQLLDEEA